VGENLKYTGLRTHLFPTVSAVRI